MRKLIKESDLFQHISFKIAYLYVMLPIIIFLIGWVHLYISIPCVCVLVFVYYLMCRHIPEQWEPVWTKEDIKKGVLIVGIVFLWVYLSGVGAFVFQNTDHNARNAIFEMLVNNPWPVTKNIVIDGANTSRGLIYYIGFWMPSAVFGKLFGITVGYCMQALWAAIGILLFYYFICVIRKKITIWPLFVFIFISGLDILGYYITRTDFSDWSNILHLEWWAQGFQFSSFTTQLFWVFNQALPAWLIVILMYLQKSNRCLVLLWGAMLLSSTFPFAGMLPFLIFFVFSRKYECDGEIRRICFKKKWWTEFLKDTLTVENVLGGGICGIVSFLYLRGNLSANVVSSGSEIHYGRGYLLLYLIFVLIEVGIYFMIIFKYQSNRAIFYITGAWLLICPLITVGFSDDFCMRASIPALIFLYLMIVDTITLAHEKKIMLSYHCC